MLSLFWLDLVYSGWLDSSQVGVANAFELIFAYSFVLWSLSFIFNLFPYFLISNLFAYFYFQSLFPFLNLNFFYHLNT